MSRADVAVIGSRTRARQGPLARLRINALKYLAVARVSAASIMAYPWAVFFRGIFLVSLIYIIGQLWIVMFAHHAQLLFGFSVKGLIYYLVATEVYTLSMPALSQSIDQEVRGGELAYLIGRPYSYVLYHYARFLGERFVRLLINICIAVPLALLFVGPPDFGWQGLLVWPLMILLAFTIEFICHFAIGLLAFWTEDTWAFSFMFSRLLLVLGGVMAPLDVFPQPLRAIAQALPFGAILYGPARMLVRFEPGLFGQLLLQQAITLAIGGILLGLFYRHASRRVSINGG